MKDHHYQVLFRFLSSKAAIYSSEYTRICLFVFPF
jgi:hypothetical protein